MGISPDEFWRLTPFEFNLMAEGFVAREERKTSDLLYLAWHVEAFARAKKLPKLETLMKKRKPKAPKKTYTKEELINIAKQKGLTGPW